MKQAAEQSGGEELRDSGGAALPQKLLKKEFPFSSRYFEVGKYRLHYVDEGKGNVLLFFHACPMWSFSFRRQIAELSKDHRVIAVDQMGFGFSDKPEDYDYRLETHIYHIERFIKTLGLNDITLIMQGRGTTIGMAYAVHHPDNVRAFISLNSMAFSDFRLPARLRICRIKWLGVKIVMTLNIFNWDFHKYPQRIRTCYELPFRNAKDKVALLRFIKEIPCIPEDASAQSMYEIESALWLLREKPAMLIWARKDWLYTLRELKKWRLYFPAAKEYIIDRAGRCCTEDAPEELSSLIRNFLDREGI